MALQLPAVSVDPGHLAGYQHLLGLPVRDTLPPGFVHILGFPAVLALLARADFPLPALGMVHLAGHIRQPAPIPSDCVLELTAWAQDLAWHPRGTTVDVHTVAAAHGHVVWHGSATYLSKGIQLMPQHQSDSASQARLSQEETEPSDWVGRHEWWLARDIGPQYAQVSGDFNPIHTSVLAAKAFGFPRTLAHGMYTAARALAELGAPDVVDWHMQFSKPVLLPATVLLEFELSDTTGRYRIVSRDGAGLHVAGSIGPPALP